MKTYLMSNEGMPSEMDKSVKSEKRTDVSSGITDRNRGESFINMPSLSIKF